MLVRILEGLTNGSAIEHLLELLLHGVPRSLRGLRVRELADPAHPLVVDLGGCVSDILQNARAKCKPYCEFSFAALNGSRDDLEITRCEGDLLVFDGNHDWGVKYGGDGCVGNVESVAVDAVLILFGHMCNL